MTRWEGNIRLSFEMRCKASRLGGFFFIFRRFLRCKKSLRNRTLNNEKEVFQMGLTIYIPQDKLS